MSKADELFKSLGYGKHSSKSHERYDLYSGDDEHLIKIVFNIITKRIAIHCDNKALDIEELQAINEKVKELRLDIKSKENLKRMQRESQRGVNMNNKTITTSVKNFENRMKSLETKNIKKYGESLTWVSLWNKFNKCIVEIDKNTITFDGEKYKEILKEMEAQYEQ